MSFPAQTIPPRIQEVLPGYKAILSADSQLETLLGGKDRVFVAIGNHLDQPAPTGSTWRRIVLMWRTDPSGKTVHPDGVNSFNWNVRVDVMPAKGEDPQINHDAIQQRVFERINGKGIDMNFAGQAYPAHLYMRTDRVFRDEKGWFYGAWSYRTVLKPATT